MAEVVVLGSGTSTGVPVLGVKYPERFLANPKNWRTRPSIAILGRHQNLLVDCTPEMRLQCLREGIDSVDRVIITHTHADHIMGMDDLRSFSEVRGGEMAIYALPEHHAIIRAVFPYAFVEAPPGVAVPRFQLEALPSEFEFDGMRVQTATVLHGSMPVTALRIGAFAYITDFSEIPEESRWILKNLDQLIISCVRIKPHRNHMHFEDVMRLLDSANPNQAYLTHLSHDFEDGISQLPARVSLSWDGLRLKI